MIHYTFPIPAEEEMPVITGGKGERYGREFSMAMSDELDAMADDYICRLNRTHRAGYTPYVLDIGGASGARAKQLSELGAKVTVFDVCDQKENIARRNKSMRNGHSISFIQGDTAQLDAIPSDDWSLINMRRFLHWIPRSQVETLFDRLPEIATGHTHIGMCFQQAAAGATDTITSHKSAHNLFYQHRAVDILGILKRSGYEILAHGSEALTSHRNYAIFARLPSPRSYIIH